MTCSQGAFVVTEGWRDGESHVVVMNHYESLHGQTRATCSHMNSTEQKRIVQEISYKMQPFVQSFKSLQNSAYCLWMDSDERRTQRNGYLTGRVGEGLIWPPSPQSKGRREGRRKRES